MLPWKWREDIIAFLIKILGVTLMIEGLGLWFFSFGETVVFLMSLCFFFSGHWGFVLPHTDAWKRQFKEEQHEKKRPWMFKLKEKSNKEKFVEKKLQEVCKHE